MSYYLDEAGRVIERATGQALGAVVTVEYGREAMHWPRNLQGDTLHRPTFVLDLAVLSVIKHARPGQRVTLWDIER
jgi:hypothetical protein